MHDLLLAQNQVLISVNSWYQQQREQANHYLKELQENEEKIKIYVKMLESKQEESQKRNHLLEIQRAELRQQAKKITELNQQLIRISQLLSIEVKIAFQATYESVNSISLATDKVVFTSNVLIRELEAVNFANKLIGDVSKQVQHLALQAAIAANRAENKLTELGYIANEIRSLGGKTLEINDQVNRIANQFKFRLPELIEAARTGETTARSLIQKIQQTQIVLNELEELVSEQNNYEPQPQLDLRDS
ncbi:MAG: hypothetical protein JOZ78_10840, partial [Chroococcidiopsidaceae cyanobacterium CP_BM_ER_R8_30]|nr:hypothetical protein [Chroococcidiopsidaceae cyanobacterium CP_BM_ER_R8_30]